MLILDKKILRFLFCILTGVGSSQSMFVEGAIYCKC